MVGADVDDRSSGGRRSSRRASCTPSSRRRPDGRPDEVGEPLIPLLDTTLLTNAPGEPSLWSQLRSGDRARPTASTSSWRSSAAAASRPLLDALRRHCDARPAAAGADHDLHRLDRAARARPAASSSAPRSGSPTTSARPASTPRRGSSTAARGSRRPTSARRTSPTRRRSRGLEWNVRVSAARNPDVVDKFAAVFDSYWEGGDFVPYDADQFDDEQRPAGRHRPRPAGHPQPDRAAARAVPGAAARARSSCRASRATTATCSSRPPAPARPSWPRSTTPASADTLPRSRLLFVAHREEILDQSLATFRYALRDASFGEKWVGGARPTRFEHVFASIQSLNASRTSAASPPTTSTS